jgi:hypothetical protein
MTEGYSSSPNLRRPETEQLTDIETDIKHIRRDIHEIRNILQILSFREKTDYSALNICIPDPEKCSHCSEFKSCKQRKTRLG